jgi:hypothetical protein
VPLTYNGHPFLFLRKEAFSQQQEWPETGVSLLILAGCIVIVPLTYNGYWEERGFQPAARVVRDLLQPAGFIQHHLLP